MLLNEAVKCVIIDNERLKKDGFDPEMFSYYVNLVVKTKSGVLSFPKCKAIERGDDEPVYFLENQSKDKTMIFKASDNPHAKIEKALLN
jgi:hypothetical protein